MLKSHKEFEYVYKKGHSAHSRSSVLFYLPKSGEKKVGYTASKKVGNAVIRNRSKRRMRALFKEQQDALADGHYVYVAKAILNDTAFDTLRRDLKYLIKKLGASQTSVMAH
jgi:ribonuclease P protein component